MTDPILHWNAISLEANRLDHTGAAAATNQRGPTRSSRALGMIHLAMHDAWFGSVVAGGPLNPSSLTPWNPATPPPPPLLAPGAGVAVSYAAHGVLVALYPSQKAWLDQALAGVLIGGAVSAAAQTFGQTVATNTLAARAADGAANSEAGGLGTGLPGEHREDPFNPGQGFLGVHYGDVHHFVLAGHVPLAAPPALGTPAYEAHFDQVKLLGQKSGSGRTPDQTIAGLYWAYDGPSEIGTPPRLYNQILVQIAKDRGLSTWQNARLLAQANVAMAEAGIEAWHHKYVHNVWRPVLGVREHGAGLGPSASAGVTALPNKADPTWEPLGAPRSNSVGARSFTPPFPAYPSGHATFGAAAFGVARKFFGESTAAPVSFTFVSDELNNSTKEMDGSIRTRHVRKFNSLLDAIFENGLSRVFLGVHWRFDATTATTPAGLLTSVDNIGGIPLGLKIADLVTTGPFTKV